MTSPRIVLLTLVLVLVCPAAGRAGVEVVTRDVPLGAQTASGARVAASADAPKRFNLVGLHWRGSGRVEFRTASPHGAWSEWHAARPEAEDGPDPGSVEATGALG